MRLWTALCLLSPRKEYLEGETLADRLAKGPLHEVDQLPAARFLCQSRSRRQQVMPEPQPNSFANIHTKPRSPFSFSSAINRGGTKPAGCDDPGFGMAPHLARTGGGRLTSELAGALTRSCGYTVPRPGTWVLFSHFRSAFRETAGPSPPSGCPCRVHGYVGEKCTPSLRYSCPYSSRPADVWRIRAARCDAGLQRGGRRNVTPVIPYFLATPLCLRQGHPTGESYESCSG